MPQGQASPPMQEAVQRAIKEQRAKEDPKLKQIRKDVANKGPIVNPPETFDQSFPVFNKIRTAVQENPDADILFEVLDSEQQADQASQLFDAVAEERGIKKKGGGEILQDFLTTPVAPFIVNRAQEMLQDPDVQKGFAQGGAVLATQILSKRFAIPSPLAKAIVTSGMEMLASAGVEVGFQKAGLSRESNEQIIGAAAAPLGGKLATAVIRRASRAVGKVLPGIAGGAQEGALRTLQSIEDRLMPQQSATRLWAIASQTGRGVKIGMKQTAQQLDELITQGSALSSGAQKQLPLAYIKGLRERIDDFGGGMPIDALNQERIVLGNLLRKMKRESDPGSPFLNKAFASMMDDLGVAAGSKKLGGRAAASLLNAVRATRREKASFEFGTLFRKHLGPLRSDDLQEVRVGQIVRDLQKRIRNRKVNKSDKVFVESFAPGELPEILDTLKRLRFIPKLPPEAGVQAGSRSVVKRAVITGGLGTAASGSFVGGAALAGTVEGMLFLLEKTMMTRAGRALARKILDQNNGILTRRGGAILGAFLAGANPEETQELVRNSQSALNTVQEFGGPLLNQLQQSLPAVTR